MLDPCSVLFACSKRQVHITPFEQTAQAEGKVLEQNKIQKPIPKIKVDEKTDYGTCALVSGVLDVRTSVSPTSRELL